MSAEGRAAVIAAAREWLGTPYHAGASLKGVGVDCALFIRAVYVEPKIVPHFDVEPYPPHWYLNQDRERFLEFVLPRATEIERDKLAPGDLVLARFGRCYSHGVVLINDNGDFIHADPKARAVIGGNMMDGAITNRPQRFFTFWSAP